MRNFFKENIIFITNAILLIALGVFLSMPNLGEEDDYQKNTNNINAVNTVPIPITTTTNIQQNISPNSNTNINNSIVPLSPLPPPRTNNFQNNEDDFEDD